MTTARLAKWALDAHKRWQGPSDDEHPAHLNRVQRAIQSTAPVGYELAEREMATQMMLTVKPDTLHEWAHDLTETEKENQTTT